MSLSFYDIPLKLAAALLTPLTFTSFCGLTAGIIEDDTNAGDQSSSKICSWSVFLRYRSLSRSELFHHSVFSIQLIFQSTSKRFKLFYLRYKVNYQILLIVVPQEPNS